MSPHLFTCVQAVKQKSKVGTRPTIMIENPPPKKRVKVASTQNVIAKTTRHFLWGNEQHANLLQQSVPQPQQAILILFVFLYVMFVGKCSLLLVCWPSTLQS
mmetsp:Transcript_14562/g.19017  ORF Transcript_14562/g.19017 Transcript_14562/m.19017 type:complete len:102 (+) Transcript_14562:482-787(+)